MKLQKGFTLIELMITVVIIGILSAIAIPSYTQHLIKASRAAVQTELMQLAALQEKIYLNSNSYTTSVTGAYSGQPTGGLGLTTGASKDGKYNITCTGCGADFFTLTATPVSGTNQATDGVLNLDSSAQRTWVGGEKPNW